MTPADKGSAVAIAGLNVLSMSLARPLLGPATLEAELDVGDKPVPLGAQVLTFARAGAPPIAYPVTIVEGRAAIGRGTVYAVGGAGGLGQELAGYDYAEVDPRVVYLDILRDSHPLDVAGAPVLTISEAPSPAALAALVGLPHLARWSRPAGTGAAALTRLAQRLTLVTGKPYGWRTMRDGAVWLGVEAWPAYVSTAPGKPAPPYYTAEPNAAGIGTIALDAPDLDPGVTIAAPEDQGTTPLRVSAVVYDLTEDGVFRARVQIAAQQPGEGREREEWRRAVMSVMPPQSLRVPWFATVVSQDSDGALGLRLEEGAPLLTLAQVPYYPGMPGLRVTVPGGAQCVVEFVGGREDSPIVRSFARATGVTLIRFDDGQAGFARVGDSVQGPTMSAVADLSTGIVTFTTTLAGGLPSAGIAPDLNGFVARGSPKFRG